MNVLGCDNGFSSSIVILNVDTLRIEHMEPYPRDNEVRLDAIVKEFKPVYAATEWPFMSISFAHVASTNFEILGRLKQTFELNNIPYECVRSATWRKRIKMKSVKGRENQKLASIEFAQMLFNKEDQHLLKSTKRKRENGHLVPFEFYDDNKCESALIAYYALLKWRDTNDITKK